MSDKAKEFKANKEESKSKTDVMKNEIVLDNKDKLEKNIVPEQKLELEENFIKKLNKGNCFGLIETNSFVTLVKAADAILKAANVSILNYEKIGNSLVAICIYGDIGSVNASIEVAIEKLKESGGPFFVSIIPSASPYVADLLMKK